MKRQSNSLTPKRKGMAQEKTPNEKPKRTRKPKAGSDALPVEQITELMLVHNKNDPKFGVQAVSEIDKDGKAKTVPADEKNENSFLKFDYSRKLHQEFLEPAQGTYPFPPAPHDLPRLQGEQAGHQGFVGGKADGCGERVPQTLRNPSERKQEGTKCKPKRKNSYGRQRGSAGVARTALPV